MASKKYVKHFFKVIYLHSVHLAFCWAVESPTIFLKKRARQDLNFWREIAGKEGVTCVSGGEEGGRSCSFYAKNKLKSKILNQKD